MNKKGKQKHYWEMNAKELAEATSEFEQEFVIDKSTPLTREMRARWQRAKSKSTGSRNGRGVEVISIQVPKNLLKRSDALARKLGISRARLVVRGLKAVLAAAGES
jgi:hypothetical protein